MDNIEKSYRLLLYLQHNLNKEKLEKIYDTDMGSHLWDKFLFYDRNILMFLNYLDKNNKVLFFNAVRVCEGNVLFDELYV